MLGSYIGINYNKELIFKAAVKSAKAAKFIYFPQVYSRAYNIM